MSFIELTPDNWQSAVTRILINGPPNSFKTTACHTFPDPKHWLSYPGEKGFAAIDVKKVKGAGGRVYVYQESDLKKFTAGTIVQQLEALTFEIIGGKYGECRVFIGDGLHKLYGWYFQKNLAELATYYAQKAPQMGEEDFAGQAYGKAHEDFLLYLNKVLHSSVPYVVFTAWDGEEKDNPQAGKNSPSHLYPDLPGKLSRRIMGEFSVVLYSEVGPPMPNGKRVGKWKVHPAGKVWGAGIKVPMSVALKIPAEVDQDWPQLEKLLFGTPVAEGAVIELPGGADDLAAKAAPKPPMPKPPVPHVPPKPPVPPKP